jgi:PEP-CTERM motif-containing protein
MREVEVSMHKKLRGKLGGLAVCACLVSMMCGQAAAAQFQWFNDPNSTTDFTLFSRSCAQTASDVCPDNTIRLADIQAVNLIGQGLPDVGFFVPSMWPRIFNPDASLSSFALTWRNDLNGWFTGNFDSSGTSLLVTASIQTPNNTPNGRIAAGSVADDQSLTRPLQDLTFTFDGLPETLAPGDLVPFIDLGSFSPFEAKSLDLVLTYHWGDNRPCCALRTAFGAFTLAPVPESTPVPVPEPATITVLGAGMAVLLIYRWRRRA